jgi:hypothetical protein
MRHVGRARFRPADVTEKYPKPHPHRGRWSRSTLPYHAVYASRTTCTHNPHPGSSKHHSIHTYTPIHYPPLYSAHHIKSARGARWDRIRSASRAGRGVDQAPRALFAPDTAAMTTAECRGGYFGVHDGGRMTNHDQQRTYTQQHTHSHSRAQHTRARATQGLDISRHRTVVVVVGSRAGGRG